MYEHYYFSMELYMFAVQDMGRQAGKADKRFGSGGGLLRRKVGSLIIA
jgi:hypothetical protein